MAQPVYFVLFYFSTLVQPTASKHYARIREDNRSRFVVDDECKMSAADNWPGQAAEVCALCAPNQDDLWFGTRLPSSVLEDQFAPFCASARPATPLTLPNSWSRHFEPTLGSIPRFVHHTLTNNTGCRHERVYFPNIEVENLEGYRIGWYHPTVIGDTFHERQYESVHKLGFGSYSTIWQLLDDVAATRRFGWLETDTCNAMSR
jgi:hypothetical protein